LPKTPEADISLREVDRSLWRYSKENKRQRDGWISKSPYTDSILQETRKRYGIARSQINPLDAFESFVARDKREI
jgi:hypothetical protein